MTNVISDPRLVDMLDTFEEGGTLFLDVETTSFHPELMALNAYNGSRIVGYALAWRQPNGQTTKPQYISLRHRDVHANNADLKENALFLYAILKRAKRWVNHNVKFDAHFVAMELWVNGIYEEFFYEGDWYCTVVASKLIDSERMSHELKELAHEWLGHAPDLRDQVKEYLRAAGSKDYGDVPSTLLGRYAINDVAINIELYDHVEAKLDPEIKQLHELERKLTAVLFDVERAGVKVDVNKLKLKTVEYLQRMIELECELAEISGYEFTDSSKHIGHIVLRDFGLPVLAFTETKKKVNGRYVVIKGGPSFDSDAIDAYVAHPRVVANERFSRFFKALRELRSRSTFYDLYLRGWAEHLDTRGYLHPSYNQIVRTGRMSCGKPNVQQIEDQAKELIICEDDEEIVAADASQIEFRLIAEYMAIVGYPEALEAYMQDPKTDYHRWVANLCGIDRKPAKNINFMKAYGGGRAKLITMLRQLEVIIDSVKAELAAMPPMDERAYAATFDAIISNRANVIYATYEERLPGLKKASRMAYDTCVARGDVRTLWGRRRKLPKDRAHIAFNTAVQGGAMDFIKEKLIQTSMRFNELYRRLRIRIRLNVHDEIVHTAPKGTFSDNRQMLANHIDLLNAQGAVKIRVPLLWEAGVSTVNYQKAKK